MVNLYGSYGYYFNKRITDNIQKNVKREQPKNSGPKPKNNQAVSKQSDNKQTKSKQSGAKQSGSKQTNRNQSGRKQSGTKRANGNQTTQRQTTPKSASSGNKTNATSKVTVNLPRAGLNLPTVTDRIMTDLAVRAAAKKAQVSKGTSRQTSPKRLNQKRTANNSWLAPISSMDKKVNTQAAKRGVLTVGQRPANTPQELVASALNQTKARQADLPQSKQAAQPTRDKVGKKAGAIPYTQGDEAQSLASQLTTVRNKIRQARRNFNAVRDLDTKLSLQKQITAYSQEEKRLEQKIRSGNHKDVNTTKIKYDMTKSEQPLASLNAFFAPTLAAKAEGMKKVQQLQKEELALSKKLQKMSQSVQGQKYKNMYYKAIADPNFAELSAQGAVMGSQVPFSTTAQKLSLMDKEDWPVYNYYRRLGREDEFLQVLDVNLNYKQRQALNAADYRAAKDNKALGALMNISSVYKAPGALIDVTARKIKNELSGNYQGLDTNNALWGGIHTQRATEQALTEDIANPVAKFLARTGLSAGQFVATLGFGGVAAPLILGSNAAGEAALNVTEKGGTVDQAFLMAYLTLGAEAGTEYLPVDNFFGGLNKLLKNATSPSRKVVRQGIIEGSKEVLAGASELLADEVVMGAQSDYNQKVKTYQAQGLSFKEAENEAIKDTCVDLGLQFTGGSFIGSALGGLSKSSPTGTDKLHTFTAQPQKLSQGKAIVNKSDQANMSRAQAVRAVDRLAINNKRQAEKAGIKTTAGALKRAMQSKDLAASLIAGSRQRLLPTYNSQQLMRKLRGTSSITEQSGLVAGATEAEIQSALELGKATGNQVVFFSEGAENGRIVDGFYDQGKIFYNVQSPNAHKFVYGYEATHPLEGTKAHEQLRQQALDFYQAAGFDLELMRQELKERYQQSLRVELADEKVDNELTANFVGNYLFDDVNSIIKLVREKRPVAEKIFHWIKRMVAKLTDKQERQFFLQAQERYARAFAELET